MMRRRQMDHQSRVLQELSLLLRNILRSPPSLIELFTDHLFAAIPPVSPSPSSSPPPVPTSRRMRATPITPAGFASLMLGITTALILCGSITFFIGFMLLPWVLGLIMVLYFVGIISSLSVLGRSILCCAISVTAKHSSYPDPPSPHKEIPAWKPM